MVLVYTPHTRRIVEIRSVQDPELRAQLEERVTRLREVAVFEWRRGSTRTDVVDLGGWP